MPIDLETICLKCLRKEPENRYASSLELAEELSRFQKGEPILARPIGNVERSVRWMKRNPAIASLMLAVLALLVLLGVGGMFAGWVFSKQAHDQMLLAESENRARRLAEEEQGKAEIAAELAKTESEHAIQVTKFLQGLFEPRDQLAIGFMSIGFQKKQSALLANDLLKSGVEKLNEPGSLIDRPIVRAELLHDIGAIYMGLGEPGEARPLLEEALQLRRLHLPGHHLDLARSIQAVADVRSIIDSVAAVQLYREAIDILKANPETDELEMAMIETRFGMFQWYLNGEPDEPKQLLHHAYEIRRGKLGDMDLQTISTLMVLTMISMETFAKADAMKMITQVLDALEKCEGKPEYLEFVKRMISSLQVKLILSREPPSNQPGSFSINPYSCSEKIISSPFEREALSPSFFSSSAKTPRCKKNRCSNIQSVFKVYRVGGSQVDFGRRRSDLRFPGVTIHLVESKYRQQSSVEPSNCCNR